MDNNGNITNLLLVDDSPAIFLALEGILKKRPLVKILKAVSGKQAISLLLEYDIALALLDVQMPDINGFEIAEVIKSNEKDSHIPIIFMIDNKEVRIQQFNSYLAGSVDYLLKPLDENILRSKIDILLDLHKKKSYIKALNENHKQIIKELKYANQKIIEQQKTIIEEEPLKGLLQITADTAHELNQPLTVLLGNIDFIKMNKANPDRLDDHLKKIYEAGKRMSEIIKKMQVITHEKNQVF